MQLVSFVAKSKLVFDEKILDLSADANGSEKKRN